MPIKQAQQKTLNYYLWEGRSVRHIFYYVFQNIAIFNNYHVFLFK